jgi:hypothetical protein
MRPTVEWVLLRATSYTAGPDEPEVYFISDYVDTVYLETPLDYVRRLVVGA